ncbi:MAG: septum formation initiator family protein [Syntrophaceae bacterium]|nr:septum formation initiator family protein [Syntrophaceae bacterium]
MSFLKIGSIVIIMIVSILYLQEQGSVQKNSLNLKISDLKQENSQLEHEIGSLGEKISRLRSDPKAVEKVAKRKLGMVRPDETIYIFETVGDKK